jgi:hypothetical protein
VVHIDDVDPEHAGAQRCRGLGSGDASSGKDPAPGHIVVAVINSRVGLVAFRMAMAIGMCDLWFRHGLTSRAPGDRFGALEGDRATESGTGRHGNAPGNTAI